MSSSPVVGSYRALSSQEALEESPFPSSQYSKSTAETSSKSSDIQAFANTIKSFIGVGILALPYGIKQSGLWSGVFSLVIIGIASAYTIKVLIKCKNEIALQKKFMTEAKGSHEPLIEQAPARELTFGEVGNHIFGKLGLYLVNFSIITGQLGICCAYVIFISENLHSIFPTHPSTFFSMILFPAMAFLSWIKNMKYLAPTSIFANLTMLLGISVIFYYGFSKLNFQTSYPVLRPSTFPAFFGIAVFGFEGINLAIPIESNMRTPQNYPKVLDFSVLVIAVVYVLFASFGYIFFGDDVKDVITLNLPGNILTLIIKICLCVQLLFTYPVQLFPVSNILESPFVKEGTSYAEIKRILFRTALVALTILVAFSIPYFGLFTALVGAFSNSLVAFIFPPLFLLSIFRGRLSWPTIILNILILIMGIVAGAVCSSLTIIDIVEKMKEG